MVSAKISNYASNLHFSSFTVILGYLAVRRMLLPGVPGSYPRNDLSVDSSFVLS